MEVGLLGMGAAPGLSWSVLLFIVCTFDWKRRKFFCKFVSLFCFFPQEKSLPGVVMALVCNVFDMLYQLANLEEPR